MSNKLSHSSINKYNNCARSYKYRYIDRIVSRYKSGALYFGTALDAALNELLDPNKQEKNPEAVFEQFWNKQEDNTHKEIELKENEDITYAKSDFDSDLLTKKDWAALYSKAKEYDLEGSPITIRKAILDKKGTVGWENLESKERKFFNLTNWLCLRNKGLLMIKTYREEIMPRFKKVLSIQKYVELKNTDEDVVRGYVDLVVEWEDGSVVLIDNKTSSMEYERDSVLKSPQLALYKMILNEWANDPNHEWNYKIEKAAFLVLRKAIKKNISKICKSCGFEAEPSSTHKTCHNTIDNKRCGGEWDRTAELKVDYQIIIDKVPDHVQDLVLENVNDVNTSIKNNVFPRNFNSCEGKFGRCEYYDLCWFNNKKDVLSIKEKKDGK